MTTTTHFTPHKAQVLQSYVLPPRFFVMVEDKEGNVLHLPMPTEYDCQALEMVINNASKEEAFRKAVADAPGAA